MGKNSLFNKQYWNNWIATSKRMRLGLYLTPHMKNNSKLTKDMDVRAKPLKPLKKT